MAERSQRFGVRLSDVNLATAELVSPRTVRWRGLVGDAVFPNHQAFERERLFQVRADQITGKLVGTQRVRVSVKGFSVESRLPEKQEGDPGNKPEAVDRTKESVTANRLELTLPIRLSDPVESIVQSLPDIVSLAKEGTTTLPTRFSGDLGFVLKGEEVSAGFFSEEVDGVARMRIVPEDLRSLAPLFDEPLTDAEMEVVATMPLRTPRLLRIKDDAESTAKREHERDDTVPQDAYRHVLWNYLLTKAYDEATAEAVTDAHEEGDTGNTEAEREMDLNNNAVGRRYATEGVRRQDVLQKLLEDPEVMVSAE